MGKKYDFDYIIIGSGPAGSTAALKLASAKKRVALVEARFFGGANLNTRNVPYAVALDFAHTYAKILTYPEFKNQDLHFNLPTIPARELKTIIAAGGNDKKIFEDAGITCIRGYANFLDPHTIAVSEKKFTANNFILATGSRLKITGISGTDLVPHLNPETAITIRRFPKVAAIIGGGATGCEIASYFASLGIKVILFEAAERLLPREDKEVNDYLSDYFAQKLDISILPNCKVVALEEDSFSKRVIFRQDNTEKLVRVDCIVLATGSQPNLDYGLENANVKYRNAGIIANKYFETSAKNIYAIGDALGQASSTDLAYQEGLTLATNLINKAKNTVDYHNFARVTKTFPEIATIGYSEDDLIKRDRKYQKSFIKLSDAIISKIDNFDYGFVKLLADKTNHIIGATIVAPHAELMAPELVIAIQQHLTALELASAPHNSNNYSQLIKLAAKQLSLNKKK